MQLHELLEKHGFDDFVVDYQQKKITINARPNFKEILLEIADMLDKKNNDYDNSYFQLRSEYGTTAFYIRIADKFNRIKKVDKSGALCDESAIDTIKDIIGYCVLELAYRTLIGE